MRSDQVPGTLPSLSLLGSLTVALCVVVSCSKESPKQTASAGRNSLRFEVVPTLVPGSGSVTLVQGYDEVVTDVRMRAGVLSDGTAGTRILFMVPEWGPHDLSVFVCDGSNAAAEGPHVVVETVWSRLGSGHEIREIHAGAGAYGWIRANRSLDESNGELVLEFSLEVETGAGDYRRSIKGDAVVKRWH
jgi:hypothetical protein